MKYAVQVETVGGWHFATSQRHSYVILAMAERNDRLRMFPGLKHRVVKLVRKVAGNGQ